MHGTCLPRDGCIHTSISVAGPSMQRSLGHSFYVSRHAGLGPTSLSRATRKPGAGFVRSSRRASQQVEQSSGRAALHASCLCHHARTPCRTCGEKHGAS